MNGIGGESILVKNALDENNNDTFNQTADNIGVEVKGSSFNSSSGDLSITGIGGKLSVEEIVEPDQDNEIVAISVASSLEGVTLSNIKTSSTGPTFISGQAGEPIAGDKNRGTTIVGSTLQMATALPGSEKNNSVSSLDNRIEGNAYSGTNDNYGLSIASTHIESTNQDLTLAGRGGLKATGEKNYGIYIGNQSSVMVGKDGNSRLLNIYGAGGDGTDMTGGILTENTSYQIDGTINMYGESQGAGQFGDNSVEIFSGVNITTSDDTNISGDNNVNISNSSVQSGGDLNSTAQDDININQTEITTDENLNATAGNDVNIDESDIASQGDVTATAGNDVNIDESDIASQGDVTATAGNDVNIDESDIATQGDVTATAGNDVNIDESHTDTRR